MTTATSVSIPVVVPLQCVEMLISKCLPFVCVKCALWSFHDVAGICTTWDISQSLAYMHAAQPASTVLIIILNAVCMTNHVTSKHAVCLVLSTLVMSQSLVHSMS